MAIGGTALANFLIILVIGIVEGLAFNRYARSWVANLPTNRNPTFSFMVDAVAPIHEHAFRVGRREGWEGLRSSSNSARPIRLTVGGKISLCPKSHQLRPRFCVPGR
jgi:hypothetical protein